MSDAEGITRALLTWYAVAQRDLPWRHTRDPYLIWVSEIMLQQTQVAKVIPYYERFVQRYPDVHALAAASLDEILVVWQGLGYYARARHLHAAARIVCQEYGGQLPSSLQALRRLPGIGEYAGGAIASIAFGQRTPAIDGNVVRVLCRLTDEERPAAGSAVRAALRSLATALLPDEGAGALNQALMELGATVCTPKTPDCPACPVSDYCLARARGTQALRPVAASRPPVPVRELATAVIVRQGRVLIVRRLPSGLLGGLWELPGVTLSSGNAPHSELCGALRDLLSLTGQIGAEVATVRHAYTHYRVVVRAYRCQARGEPRATGPWDACHWLAREERVAYGLTGVASRVLAEVPWAVSAPLI